MTLPWYGIKPPCNGKMHATYFLLLELNCSSIANYFATTVVDQTFG